MKTLHSPNRRFFRTFFAGVACIAAVFYTAIPCKSQDQPVPTDVRNLAPPAYSNSTVAVPVPDQSIGGDGAVPYRGGPAPIPISLDSRSRPSVISGRRLKLSPGQTATEKALELEQELAATNRKNQRLAGQLEVLTTDLKRQKQELKNATDAIQAARQELEQVRNQLQNWKETVQVLSDKIREAEVENRKNLEESIRLLQKQLGISVEND